MAHWKWATHFKTRPSILDSTHFNLKFKWRGKPHDLRNGIMNACRIVAVNDFFGIKQKSNISCVRKCFWKGKHPKPDSFKMRDSWYKARFGVSIETALFMPKLCILVNHMWIYCVIWEHTQSFSGKVTILKPKPSKRAFPRDSLKTKTVTKKAENDMQTELSKEKTFFKAVKIEKWQELLIIGNI